MDICEYNKCTGCSACANICNKGCISMIEDEFGEKHPKIDTEKCVECGLCIKVCPNNNVINFNYPQTCYAAWRTNKSKRSLSASGGIAAVFSEYIIEKKHGIVFGADYDDSLAPIITYTDSIEGAERFKGSKYVQSEISSDLFKNVKTFLKQGLDVLYIGTPCQVAGLLSYLQKTYEKLITIDLICHGVSPSSYLRDEISYICKKNNIELSEISNIRFRGNDSTEIPKWQKLLGKGESNNFALTLWKSVNGKQQRLFRQSKNENYYLAGFLQGVSLRENCYGCSYARPDRVSDITIGDFIGLGRTEPLPVKKEGHVSSITINTPKGRHFFDDIANSEYDLIFIEREYSERLEYRPSLMEPFHRHKLNHKFRELYKHRGYIYAIHKTLRNKLFILRSKEILMYYGSLLERIFRFNTLWK